MKISLSKILIFFGGLFLLLSLLCTCLTIDGFRINSEYFSIGALCTGYNLDLAAPSEGCPSNPTPSTLDTTIYDNLNGIITCLIISIGALLSVGAVTIVCGAWRGGQHGGHYWVANAGMLVLAGIASGTYILFLVHYVGSFANPTWYYFTVSGTGIDYTPVWIASDLIVAAVIIAIFAIAMRSTQIKRLRTTFAAEGILIWLVTWIIGHVILASLL